MKHIVIAEERCKGCGLCIAVCPKGAIQFSDTMNNKGVYPVMFNETVTCLGCALCAKMCPDAVIEVYK